MKNNDQMHATVDHDAHTDVDEFDYIHEIGILSNDHDPDVDQDKFIHLFINKPGPSGNKVQKLASTKFTSHTVTETDITNKSITLTAPSDWHSSQTSYTLNSNNSKFENNLEPAGATTGDKIRNVIDNTNGNVTLTWTEDTQDYIIEGSLITISWESKKYEGTENVLERPHSVSYHNLYMLGLQAIKDLKKQVVDLTARVAALENAS